MLEWRGHGCELSHPSALLALTLETDARTHVAAVERGWLLMKPWMLYTMERCPADSDQHGLQPPRLPSPLELCDGPSHRMIVVHARLCPLHWH